MPDIHSNYGYTAVSDFESCPYKYKLKYIANAKTFPSDDPSNPLYIGTALHKGLETDSETAIKEYKKNFHTIDDRHIIEIMKLENLIKRGKQLIPDGQHEVFINDKNWCGTLDLLVPVENGEFDLYDFKYSNHVERYIISRQLHLYRYYAEKHGYKIRDMYFVMFPKVLYKQKKSETVQQFRNRSIKKLNEMEIKIINVKFDPLKVIEHLELTQDIANTTEFIKTPNYFCNWCDYKNLCEKGSNIDMLPSIENVPATMSEYKKIWVYGEPFGGKTHLVSQAPAPVLELNTDGNVKNYTMPRIAIKDDVSQDGRHTERVWAWEKFKNAIDDLEKGSQFKTVAVDLLEDVYDSCRAYVCNERGWEHESDDSFKAYDIVRTEFLRTLKKLLNLPYNIILVSHVDTSKDVTKRTGDKVTQIKPNITDKLANKVAGMVDIVVRAIKDNNEYTVSTKTSDIIFGGGRLDDMKAVEVPNSWESIEKIYNSNKTATEQPKNEPPRAEHNQPAKVDDKEEIHAESETAPTQTGEQAEKVSEDKPTENEPPKPRTRKTRTTEPQEDKAPFETDEPKQQEEETPAQPPRRTRRTRA